MTKHDDEIPAYHYPSKDNKDFLDDCHNGYYNRLNNGKGDDDDDCDELAVSAVGGWMALICIRILHGRD